MMIFPLFSHLQAIQTKYIQTQADQTKQCTLSDKSYSFFKPSCTVLDEDKPQKDFMLMSSNVGKFVQH